MTAPVTLTFADGSQVALSRVGDVVTAVATPGALTSFGPPAQAIPAGFAPGGNISLYTLSAPAFGSGAWSLLVDEIGYFGSVGITPQSGGAGPWSPFTAQWLADPAPADPATATTTTLTFSDGTTVTLSRAGNVVTAAAVAGSNPGSAFATIPLPTMYSPAGNVAAYEFRSTGPYGEPGNWFITVAETPAIGIGLGLGIGAGGAGPWPSFVVQWLADAATAPPSTGADELADFYVHTVTVETYQGTNGYGEDLFAAPVAVAGFLDDSRKLVRSLTGEQVISESQFYTRPINGALFSADSRVTVDGVVSRVIRTNVNTSGDLDLPDHAVVSLT